MPKFEGYDELEASAEEYSSLMGKYDNVLFGEYALSNEFVRLPKSIDVQPLKLLGLILSKIKYKEDNRPLIGYDLEGKPIYDKVRIDCTLSEIRKACNVDHLNYEYYKDIARELIKSSYVEGSVNGEDIMGYAIPSVVSVPEAEQITFTFELQDKFLPHFQQLAEHYTVLELEQAKRFKSRFSYNLWMNLLSWSRENEAHYRFYTTKQMKELFGLSKDDYCKKDGKFDRYNFEKKTIEVAVAEINEFTNMRVAWKKNYAGKRVSNYQFEFIDWNYKDETPKKKIYELNQTEYEDKYAEDNGALPGQINFYNWLEEE